MQYILIVSSKKIIEYMLFYIELTLPPPPPPPLNNVFYNKYRFVLLTGNVEITQVSLKFRR